MYPNVSIDPIQRLILELGRLPGIGERSAARLAFHIIKASCLKQGGAASSGAPSLARDLAAALIAVTEQVRLCRSCQNLCSSEQCSICTDPRRDGRVLCIVKGVACVRAIESSGGYRGRYHVLHGALAPLDGIGPRELKLDEVVRRIQSEQIAEVILATNADVEGDATALYLTQLIRPLGIRISRIASGIPMGGELEFIDQATLQRALEERRSV